MQKFLSDLFSVGISKFLIISFSLITSIIVARTLGPEKNGIIATLLVYPSLFMTVGSLGIRQSTTFFVGKQLFNEKQVKTAITQIWLFTSFLSVVICFLLIYYLSKSGDNLLLILLAVLPVPFSLFNTYNSGIFLGNNQIRMFNKINWIPPFIILILTCLTLLWFSFDIAGYLVAMFGGPFFIFIILLFKNNFLHAFSLKVEWDIIRKLISLGSVYALALLIISLNYKLDVILLDYYSIPYETGIYSKGVAIIEYLWQIPMLLSTIVFARSAVAKNGKLFSLKVAQLLRLSFIAIISGSLILGLSSKLIIVGMFGEEFRGSTTVMNILLPGVILLTIFKILNMDLAGKGKPWVALLAMGPSLIINIILNIIWIPEHGAEGASMASTLSYSIAAMLFLYFYSKETGVSFKEIIYYKKEDFKPFLQIIKKIK